VTYRSPAAPAARGARRRTIPQPASEGRRSNFSGRSPGLSLTPSILNLLRDEFNVDFQAKSENRTNSLL